MHRPVSFILLVILAGGVFGQTPPPKTNEFAAQVKSIQEDQRVSAATDYIDKNRDGILREWSDITEINTPSHQEKERAAYIESLLKKYQLQEIRYDAVGNLIAVRKGTGGGPVVVFDAHLDTVFQPGLKIKTS